MMLYIAVFIVFIAAFMLIYSMLVLVTRDRTIIAKRVKQVKLLNTAKEDESISRTFAERTIAPFYKALGDFLLKATPKNKLDALNKKLEKAGMLKNSSTEKYLYTKSIAVLIFSSCMGLLAYAASHSFLKTLGLFALMTLCTNAFFNFYLSRKVESRKSKILKDLPYTLDLITVSVEAGLSFDGAMARVVTNISGELCDEFSKCLKEVRMGIERKIALRNMSERCDVRELSMLITSLIQADELGVSLGRVLRIESANLREHRKQAAREKAMKAPIKMLFPLVFFIFPSIFIIILGPAVIQIVKAFTAK
ncbi:bacterial type II secretion system protein F domain protein [Clostridiales bacterium oral taxon 876 str. F0540]|nr:bacterial type II secretion system protein F domain protein [Clostridiales bacterium oral taxon 876 str. F0540]